MIFYIFNFYQFYYLSNKMLISSLTILHLPVCPGIFPNFYICYILSLLSTILIFKMAVVCSVIKCCILLIQLHVILLNLLIFCPLHIFQLFTYLLFYSPTLYFTLFYYDSVDTVKFEMGFYSYMSLLTKPSTSEVFFFSSYCALEQHC